MITHFFKTRYLAMDGRLLASLGVQSHFWGLGCLGLLPTLPLNSHLFLMLPVMQTSMNLHPLLSSATGDVAELWFHHGNKLQRLSLLICVSSSQSSPCYQIEIPSWALLSHPFQRTTRCCHVPSPPTFIYLFICPNRDCMFMTFISLPLTLYAWLCHLIIKTGTSSITNGFCSCNCFSLASFSVQYLCWRQPSPEALISCGWQFSSIFLSQAVSGFPSLDWEA